MATYVAVFALVLAYVAVVAAYLALRTLAKLRRATSVLAKGARGPEANASLIEATHRNTERTEVIAEEIADLRALVADGLKNRKDGARVAAGGLGNVALVRYDAFNAGRAGEADAALVPLENSVEGAVPATLDELASGVPLIIADEVYLSVTFELMVRPGTTLDAVRSVATHPHAEAQVRRWLINNLPDAPVSLVGSTAGAARAVAAGEYDAAVGAAVAGELNGLEIAAKDIADNAAAVTRVVLLTLPA